LEQKIAQIFIFGRDFASMVPKGSEECCRLPRAVPLPRPLSWIKGPTSKGKKEEPTFPRMEGKEDWERITKIKIHSYGNGAVHGH